MKTPQIPALPGCTPLGLRETPKMRTTPFTVTSTSGKRRMYQVRMEGRLIATYPAADFEIVARPHECALSRALAARYAGDQGVTKALRCFKTKSSFLVETP